MGIDSVVCAVNAITEIIEQQAFMEGIATLLPSGEARVRITEVPISEGAPAAGKKLYEIDLPKEVIIGCILRGQKSIIPRGGTQILPGDMLIVISSNNQEMNAIEVLTVQK
jgi:trk system potassium uptake protein TrkA